MAELSSLSASTLASSQLRPQLPSFLSPHLFIQPSAPPWLPLILSDLSFYLFTVAKSLKRGSLLAFPADFFILAESSSCCIINSPMAQAQLVRSLARASARALSPALSPSLSLSLSVS
eukprot:1563508-Rhodomonas_salina.1